MYVDEDISEETKEQHPLNDYILLTGVTQT